MAMVFQLTVRKEEGNNNKSIVSLFLTFEHIVCVEI